jgi:predicted RNase H-like nuclease (RuvC/YqgF family)
MNEIDKLKEKIEALNKEIQVLKERLRVHNQAISKLIIKLDQIEDHENDESSLLIASISKE